MTARSCDVQNKTSWAYAVYKKQNGLCALCGEIMRPESMNRQIRPTWDHIHPKSQGGSNDRSNVQLAHGLCNNLRGTTPIHTWHENLNSGNGMDQLRKRIERSWRSFK